MMQKTPNLFFAHSLYLCALFSLGNVKEYYLIIKDKMIITSSNFKPMTIKLIDRFYVETDMTDFRNLHN